VIKLCFRSGDFTPVGLRGNPLVRWSRSSSRCSMLHYGRTEELKSKVVELSSSKLRLTFTAIKNVH